MVGRDHKDMKQAITLYKLGNPNPKELKTHLTISFLFFTLVDDQITLLTKRVLVR